MAKRSLTNRELVILFVAMLVVSLATWGLADYLLS